MSRIELVLTRTSAGGGRKQALVNGVARRPSALGAALPVVLFAPEDMLLIVGSPSGRRGQVDTLVAQTVPAAAATMATYARALTQRNNLLEAVRDGFAAPDELRFWDGVIVEEGGQIVDWRRAALSALCRTSRRRARRDRARRAAARISYLSKETPGPDETTSDAIRRRLAETAEKEQWNGPTLVGPHRDDVSFVAAGRDLSGFASRGQQRTAILAFKLAKLDVLRQAHGRPPLLLLDDVFSELDPQRRAHLVRRIGELPQAFVTTTTADDLDPALVAASTVWQVGTGPACARDDGVEIAPAADAPRRRRPARSGFGAGHRPRAEAGAPDGSVATHRGRARAGRLAVHRYCCRCSRRRSWSARPARSSPRSSA